VVCNHAAAVCYQGDRYVGSFRYLLNYAKKEYTHRHSGRHGHSTPCFREFLSKQNGLKAKHHPRCFGIMVGHDLFFLTLGTLFDFRH
jgi:hypothetical protein